ncbi:MAG: lysine biosynthesis protein LysW [Planctomycetota bacterium]|nr:lysine biosynthesis protein LysW [Planctomycetota bacterium]
MSSQVSAALNQLECPECAGGIRLARAPMRGEVVRCGECSVELEVVNTDPLTLELAPQVQEDWGE